MPSHPLSPSQPCWPPGAGHRWGPHHPAMGAASLCIPLGSCLHAGTVTWIAAAHTPTPAQPQIATTGEVSWCAPYILHPLHIDPGGCSLLPRILYGSLEMAPLSLPWSFQKLCGVHPARPVVLTTCESVFVTMFPPPSRVSTPVDLMTSDLCVLGLQWVFLQSPSPLLAPGSHRTSATLPSPRAPRAWDLLCPSQEPEAESPPQSPAP